MKSKSRNPISRDLNGRPGSWGFSLLEILVALAILALSLGVLLRIFAGGGHIARTSDEYARAVLTAESLMNSFGAQIPLTPGISQGDLPEGYHWELKVMPYVFNPSLLGDSAQNAVGVALPYTLELTVSWGGEEDPRVFSLQSLRLIPQKPSGAKFQ